MRAIDIHNRLSAILPTLVDDFSTQVQITALVSAGTTATVTTGVQHNLTVGKIVNITGALTPIAIASINRVGIVATLVTQSDHDITENAGYDVQIEGAIESEFNGTFVLFRVPNRRTLKFVVLDTGPIVATGSPLLLSGSSIFRDYNGLYEVTNVLSAFGFQFELTNAGLFSPARGVIIAKTSPRISTSIDFDRILEGYTKQQPNEAWLFVVLGDAVADKNRNIDTDSTDNIQSGHYYNQRLIQSVQLFVFIPTTGQIDGRLARDRCEELLKPICNSLLLVKFPSLVENSNNPLMISSHGLQAYSTAFYAHQYTFESTIQLGPTDVHIPVDDVAFRDIDLTMGLDVGSETFDTMIDLDDEAL